jgi:hypothetical protein
MLNNKPAKIEAGGGFFQMPESKTQGGGQVATNRKRLLLITKF